MRTKLRIAFVSLVPDSGHVIPLLRIARACRAAGHEVTCFLPDENVGMRGAEELDLVGIGDFRSKHRTAAAAAYRYSPWRLNRPDTTFEVYGNADSAFQWAREALQWSASAAIEGLVSRLRAMKPDVLVTESHVFEDWYVFLAGLLGVPLVMSYSEGTMRRWQPDYEYVLADRDRRPRALRRAIAKLWTVPPFVLSKATSFRISRLSPEMRRMREEREENLSRAFPGDSITWGSPTMKRGRLLGHGVVAGLAPVEIRRFGARMLVPDFIAAFGPIVTKDRESMPEELRAWFAAQGDRPVVYVSFGTIVSIAPPQAAVIARAAKTLGVSMLWALPSHERIFRPSDLPSDVRVEARVPQRAVLAHPAVRCCVTHAGAGTVQEALVEGKPLVCMPALWDQFYNSVLVESLGVGRQLSWGRLSERRFVETVRAVVRSPEVRRAAEQLGRELVEMQGQVEIVRYVERLAAAPREAG